MHMPSIMQMSALRALDNWSGYLFKSLWNTKRFVLPNALPVSWHCKSQVIYVPIYYKSVWLSKQIHVYRENVVERIRIYIVLPIFLLH